MRVFDTSGARRFNAFKVSIGPILGPAACCDVSLFQGMLLCVFHFFLPGDLVAAY